MRAFPSAYAVFTTTGAPFLPLAFRVAVSFGLMMLHLAIPREGNRALPGESIYLTLLLLTFLESVWEVSQNLRRTGNMFATPSKFGVRFNLLLTIGLIALLVAFQGVDQERFATTYLFPVLASAFYLTIPEIVGVSAMCAITHLVTLLLFGLGVIPAFGHTNRTEELLHWRYLFTFASLQIFSATLVVVLIRKHLETLRSSLKESNAAVDTLSAMYRRVFESMFSGLVTTDLQGRVTSANPAAEAILRRALPLGEEIPELELMLGGNLTFPMREPRFERAFTTPNGTRCLLGGNLAPIRDGDGVPQGYLLLFQDLTDIKALEERTRLAERMATIGELSASLAHELRNPMASILGCVQLLRQGEPSPQLFDRALVILQRESERVSAIVTDFLEFAKPRVTRPQKLWFPSVVDELMASWETDPRCRGIALHHQPPPERWVEGDPLNVHQVFTNLLSNARKAVADVPQPELRLTFQVDGAHLQVTLHDNGCGMDPAMAQTLFIPFTSGFQEGTGLGMSLVYRFVQQMGWEIHVESAPQAGTSIHLTIPLTEPPDTSQP